MDLQKSKCNRRRRRPIKACKQRLLATKWLRHTSKTNAHSSQLQKVAQLLEKASSSCHADRALLCTQTSCPHDNHSCNAEQETSVSEGAAPLYGEPGEYSPTCCHPNLATDFPQEQLLALESQAQPWE